MSVVDWGRASGFISQGVGPVGGGESGRVGIWARWGDKQGGSLARWDRVLGGGASLAGGVEGRCGRGGQVLSISSFA